MPITIPSAPIGELGAQWRACVGTGRLDLALRADYRESLALVRREIGFEFIRGHGLLSEGLGILRESEGTRRYGFVYLDEVIDSYLDLGIRPFLELGFMPRLLASGDQEVFWWRGNVTPPRDYREWTALVQAVLRHLIARYGLEEVLRWPIEVWNEPNLDVFWQGADQAEYFRLYERTAHAVKEVDAALQVGGPATSPGAEDWYAPFIEHVTSRGVPCDFFSIHAYTSTPPAHIPFGVYQGLRPAQDLLRQFAAPRRALAGTPLEGAPVHITEFNTSYRPDNPIHDTALQAAYLAPVLANGGDLVDSFSYWTFCDVFEEQGIPSSLFHGGFGLLGYRQLRKPAYHLYAFMARLGRDVLARGSDHLVTRHPDGRVAILAWQPVTGESLAEYGAAPASHRLRLSLEAGAAPEYALVRRSVDEEDGNAWTLWRELGRPRSPGRVEMDLLQAASEPRVRHGSLRAEGGRVELDLSLTRHEVTLVELVPVRAEHHEGLDDDRLLGAPASPSQR